MVSCKTQIKKQIKEQRAKNKHKKRGE